MLNGISLTWLLGGWSAAVAVLVAWSAGMDARLSTSALLLVIGMAPAVVLLRMRAGAPASTVAEILHPVSARDGRGRSGGSL